MKLLSFLFAISAFPLLIFGQQIELVTPLDEVIEETSGLINLDGKIISHNDSGDEAALYEIDTLSGNISRKVFIRNAANTDWEDICMDSSYIYIGDFGNNNGSRTDLKIYRLSITDYLMSANDTVTVDTINFSYVDQSDFTPSQYSTNFDAEALIAYKDSLYLFTKNWGDNRTNIYALSKEPGTYQISKTDHFDSQGLVTAATYNPLSNTIMLTGYAFISPFIIRLSQFNDNQISSGTIERYPIQIDGSFQVESITFFDEDQYYFTTEKSLTGSSALYRLESKNLVDAKILKKASFIFYPNPASDYINIEYDHFFKAEIYDTLGTLQIISDKKRIDVSQLIKGTYVVLIRETGGKEIRSEKLIIK